MVALTDVTPRLRRLKQWLSSLLTVAVRNAPGAVSQSPPVQSVTSREVHGLWRGTPRTPDLQEGPRRRCCNQASANMSALFHGHRHVLTRYVASKATATVSKVTEVDSGQLFEKSQQLALTCLPVVLLAFHEEFS